MMQTISTATWNVPLARSAAYDLLSLGFMYPEAGACRALEARARAFSDAAAALGWDEAASAAGALAERLAAMSDERLLEDHVETFGHGVSNDCPQYEGEYLDAHIFQKTHALAELNAFYNAFGVKVSPDLRDRLDHVSVELEFMHLLAFKEAYALRQGHDADKVSICREAQTAFLSQHLATWSKSFVKRARKKAGPDSYYGLLAGLLEVHMKAEFAAHGIKPAPSHQVIIPLAQEDESDDWTECPVASNPL